MADTSAVIALLNADDADHGAVRAVWEAEPDAWVLPWAVLPEIDYLARRYLGERVARLFLRDIAEGAFAVEHGQPGDVMRARDLDARYSDLNLGLVDGVVAAVAERLGARGIATLDLRDFGSLELAGGPKLYPRDFHPG